MNSPILCTGALLAAMALVACAAPRAGTETDNPFQQQPEPEGPPPYESPIEFNPDDPAVPGCPGQEDDTGPARGPYWRQAGDHLLVGALNSLEPPGLVVVDVSDPSSPRLRGRAPLLGYVHAVAASGNDVAVVTLERVVPPTDAIPGPEDRAAVLRLVHFDVSDPDQPERVGSEELDGEFWKLVERDGAVWVMSATLAEAPPSCRFPWEGCSHPGRIELVVRGFAFAADGFAPIDSARLPMTQRAWAGQDGFVSATVAEDRTPTGLHVARFDGAALVLTEVSGEIAPDPHTPVGVVGDRLYYFAGGEGATLHVVDVSDEEGVELAAVSGLPPSPRAGVVFEAERVVVGSEVSRAAAVVGLEDPGAPTVTAMPSGVWAALPLDDGTVESPRFLGWGDVDQSGFFSVGVVEGGALTRVARTEFSAQLAQQSGSALFLPDMVVSGDRVAFLARRYEAYSVQRVLGSVDTASDPVRVDVVEAHAEEIVDGTDAWLTADGFGASSIPFSGEAASSIDLQTEWVIDVTKVGEQRVSLALGLDGATRLVVRDDGGDELGRVEVPGTARSLLPMGSRVAVLEPDEGSECEQQGGRDCDVRGIEVFELGGSPTSTGRIDFPSLAVDSPTGTTTVEQYAHPPLELGDAEWLLALESSITCSLVSECEANGIAHRSLADANVVPASLAPCPEGELCPEPPPPPEVWGTRRELALYRLEADAEGRPALSELGRSTLELQDSSFAEPVIGRGEVLVTRRELLLERGQASKRATASFMLDRFPLDGAERPAPLNVPGYAIGTSDDGAVFTVEPGTDTDAIATLHRLRVEEPGAYVEASRAFAGRYGDVHVIGDHAYYLGQGVDACQASFLQAVTLDDLSSLEPHELPGPRWDYVDHSDDQLLLYGQGGYALFDVEGGQLSLSRFHTPEVWTDSVRLVDGEVW